jgi:glycosyltransferase involved in cell wall biosynthesis
MSSRDFQPCIVIPVYNHEKAIGQLLPELLNYGLPILLVDDGSHLACRRELEQQTAKHTQLQLLQLANNRGKGGAVKAGLLKAESLGYSHAIQIDADGQHCADDILRFIGQGEKYPTAIICGSPIYDDSVPRLRYYARYLTHIWIWINTLSFKISDSMCGFRLYPLATTAQLIKTNSMGDRMDFDPEILVRWVWEGGEIINIPTQVRYPLDGVSHFAPWRDNYLISKMHAKLFFLMLLRSPRIIIQKILPAEKKHV